jgi:ankyrin repeat protein
MGVLPMEPSLKDQVLRAVTEGDLARLAQFIEAEGPRAVRLDDDPQELTALHWAAAAGQLDMVRFLLSPAVGADPRAARDNNFTPLHAAAMQGHAQVCEILLDAGAGVDVQTSPQSYAPLHSAAFGGHMEAVRVLLAHGADRDLLNYRRERPADTAKRQGQGRVEQILRAVSDGRPDVPRTRAAVDY